MIDIPPNPTPAFGQDSSRRADLAPRWYLPEGVARVWTARLDVPLSALSGFASTLSPSELARAARFHFDRHRRRFVAGRGILRALLGRCLDLDPAQLRFVYGAFGKPALAPEFGGGIQFNLSHSADLAVAAITRDHPVGIDVEEVRPLADAASLVARFFSARENAAYQTLPSVSRPTAFYNLWTRKEAWLKATGQGISHGLHRVEVTFLPEEPARLLNVPPDLNPFGSWSLHDFQPAPGFTAALAANTPNLHVEYYRWPEVSQQTLSPRYD